ncbi:putative amine oxidase [copper-containing] [Mytilus californianus]|uniref:putative amine oxidase [copper-containing] n=1 Tax=Mytilus californianus TaxID=6549 RepID=UPI002245B973|nr:putative amine oxidase [copper-containing] [Mytilus californianus]
MFLKENVSIGVCGRNSENPYGRINTNETKYPSVFSDLTRKEMKSLLNYLYSSKELNLTKFRNATLRSNYLYLAELFMPSKAAVLNYIDNGYSKPSREAHVVLIRGGDPKPNVLEIVVGPLPFPNGYRLFPYRPQPIPFFQRPITSIESISRRLKKYVDKKFGRALYELYGGSLINCGNKCLDVGLAAEVPISKSEEKSFYWYSFHQNPEYKILRPVDFSVYVEINFKRFKILKIWFNGRIFEKWKQVRDFYRRNKSRIKKIHFPEESDNIPLSMKRRGQPPFSKPLRNPSQISPDGKRYNIKGRQVTYMFWKFDISMSIFTGLRLFDIRFKGLRIAYEISVQELTSFYSGYKPTEHYFNFFDVRILLGLRSKYLEPGVDCPIDATYVGSYFVDRNSDTPIHNERSFCVFELNTEMPLRRHHGYSRSSHRFYEGMVSVVLIVRTIITAGNYDYIIDYIFYQTGGIEVKVSASGVIIATYHGRQNPYSFEISENLMGLIHQHLYHFKVDMDIKGRNNRFETLDIENDVVSSNENPNSKIHQIKFARKLKVTEKQAAYKHNFQQPKLLVISNNNIKDKFGNTPGYRILNTGLTHNIRPPGTGNEPGISWSRYQVAITKRKESEPGSSSIYQHKNPDQPIVRFQDFIDDDENIVDKDIVAWITMGFYHIPTKEDLPDTHTLGTGQSFFLLPFNYYDENPAMSSRNAIRIDPIDVKGQTKSVKIERYGVRKDIDCIPPKNYYDQRIREDPCLVVQCL